jgi:DNA-binding SARP family transcriptional activator
MKFCLLGPLLVGRGGDVVPVSPGKQRALLAALLLNANRMVPLDELAQALWGSAPPPSARATLRNYVKRLRKALEGADGSRISTLPRGYMICVDAGELDVFRFEALQGSAQLAAREGAWDRAAAQLRAALSLWRGEALADVPSEWLTLREVPRLAEMRLQAVDARIEADLSLGRHADVIAELRQLTAVQPLRERLHALLMLALYRDGRQAEALTAYQRARRALIEELGAEPGPELRELQQQILAADPALAAPAQARLRSAAAPAQPGAGQRTQAAVLRQLPVAVRHFTGRAAEMAALTSMADHAAGTGRAVVISAIAGTAGVGKTAIAVQWAHEVADKFPDGQLYVNLRGYDPVQPMAATDALAGFLRAMGVPGQDIPAAAEECAARYRSLLAGRRMLVVLDNAGSAEQVRPLLPGTPGCAVVVTSRDALAGLVARDGAHRLDLDLLPLGAAVGLLRALIGGRADADPAAAEALAIQCARLPLALRVAAELAAARSAAPLHVLVSELADQSQRLDLLDAGGDPRTAMRAVFSWSYQHLDAGAARACRLLGLHPGADFDCYAAAALTGTTIGRACHLLDRLARAHLIQAAQPGRHGMHDLLRAYAVEQALRDDTEPDRQAARTRLFDHYLYTAAAAMDTAFPAEQHNRPCIRPPATPVPPVTGQAAARAWLDTQRATLAAVAGYAADHGWPGHATRLAATLFRYLDSGGHYADALAIHACARRAARHSCDRAAEAVALTSLAVADMRQGRYQQSASHLRQALALFRESGDLTGEARAVANLGLLDHQRGRYQDAADYDQQAVDMFRQIGNRTGQATALSNLGCAEQRLGRYQQAAGHLQQALALFCETGDHHGEAYALGETGNLCLRQGEYQQAAEHQRQALALFRETGDRTGEAHTLADLGAAEHGLGRYLQAATLQRQALALVRETGERSSEILALNRLGEVLLATGEPGQARAQHAAALSLADQIGDCYEQARAHNGLARTRDATGDSGGARQHRQQALTLYTDLGAPEADQVRAQLTTDSEQSHDQP